MKLVVAVIRAENLQAVLASLKTTEGSLIAVSQLVSDGSQPRAAGTYRGTRFSVTQTKLRVEIAAKEQAVEKVIAAVVESGYSADPEQADDVKVFVMPLDACALSVSTAEDVRGVARPRSNRWLVEEGVPAGLLPTSTAGGRHDLN